MSTPALRMVVAAGLAALLPQGSPAGEVPAAADGLQVNDMTFNIRYGTADDGENRWEKRREFLFDVLRDHRPDVVGLQEVLRFQADEIHQALSGYAEVGVAAVPDSKKSEHTLVLYRKARFRLAEGGTFWFSDTPEVPASKGWGNTQPRICTWARLIEKTSGRAFCLFNLHIDHISQPSRDRSAEYVSKRIRERSRLDPVVLTGDFNAGEDNPAIRYLKGELPPRGGKEEWWPPALVDTFRVLHPEAVDVGTFHGFKGTTKGAKIDFIFAQPGVRVLKAEILRVQRNGRYPSDHFPVTAVLWFPRVEGL